MMTLETVDYVISVEGFKPDVSENLIGMWTGRKGEWSDISIYFHSKGNGFYLYIQAISLAYLYSHRCEQGLNLRGETPLDFKSNALTTRPSQLVLSIAQLL